MSQFPVQQGITVEQIDAELARRRASRTQAAASPGWSWEGNTGASSTLFEYEQGPQRTAMEYLTGQQTAPQGQLRVGAAGDIDNQMTAVALADMSRRRPDFAKLPYEQQLAIVQRNMAAESQGGGFPGRSVPMEQLAPMAAGRLRGAMAGEFEYQDPNQRMQDMQLVGAATAQRNQAIDQQRAQSMLGIPGMAGAAANAATLGVPSLVAGPDSQFNKQQAAFAESNPIQSALGTAAGTLMPGGGFATMAGEAARVARGAVQQAGGGLARQAAASIGGGFAGGELASAITGVNQAIGNRQGDVLQAGFDNTTFGGLANISAKLARGENLDHTDAGFLISLGAGLLMGARDAGEVAKDPANRALLAAREIDLSRPEGLPEQAPVEGRTIQDPTDPANMTDEQLAQEFPHLVKKPEASTPESRAAQKAAADAWVKQEVAKVDAEAQAELAKTFEQQPDLAFLENPPALTREQILAQVDKDHGAGQSQIIEALMSMPDNRGDYVMVDLPMDRVDLDQLKSDIKDNNAEFSSAKVKQYASQPGETAPPIIGVMSPVAKGKIMAVDGRHRTIAAMGRQDATIKAYVPKAFADTLPKPKSEAVAQRASPEAPLREAPRAPVSGGEPVAKAETPRHRRPGKPTDDEIARIVRERMAKRLGKRIMEQARQEPKAEPATQAQAATPALPDSEFSTPEQVLETQSAPPEGGADALAKGSVAKAPAPDQTATETGTQRAVEVAAQTAKPTPGLAKVKANAQEIMKSSGGDWRKMKFSRVGDPELAALRQMSTDQNLNHVLDEQLRQRGVRSTDDATIEGLVARDIKRGKRDSGPQTEPVEVEDYVEPEMEDVDPGQADEAEGLTEQGDASPVTPKGWFAKRALRQQGQQIADVGSPHRAISRLAGALGLGNPGIGRITKKWAAGWYMAKPEVIRMKMADMMGVFAHEVGHHLHKLVLQGRKSVARGTGLDAAVLDTLPGKIPEELLAAGRALYGKRRPASGYRAEGWAELTRMAFTDRAAAAQAFPQAYPWFIKRLQQGFPDEYAALERFRSDYQAYEAGTPSAKLLGYIARATATDPKPARQRFRAMADRANMLFFDDMHALVALKRDLNVEGQLSEKGVRLSGLNDPEILARRKTGRIKGDMTRALEYGRFDPETGTRTGKSYREILEPVYHAIDQFDGYLAARRALEKRGQGYKGILPALSDADLRASIRDLEAKYPEFKAAAQEFQEFNRWLIRDYAVHHHLLSEAQADKIIAKNLEYATFLPVQYDDPGFIGRILGKKSRQYTETGSGVRYFSRAIGGQQIEPVTRAFVASMEGIIRRAQSNAVSRAIVDLAPQIEGTGRFFRKIEAPKEVTKIGGPEMREMITKRLENQGIDVDDSMVDAVLSLVEDSDFEFWRRGSRVNKNKGEFTVMRDGKAEYWEIPPGEDTRFFREFVEGLHQAGALTGYVRLLSLPRSLIRAGATEYNPEFFISNFIRDTFQAMVTSDVGRSSGLAETGARARARLEGYVKAIWTGEPGDAYVGSGAQMGSVFQEYADAKGKPDLSVVMGNTPRMLRAFYDSNRPAWKKATVDVALAVPRLIKRLNERFELANRLAEFNVKGVELDAERAKAIFGTRSPTSDQIAQAKKFRTQADVYDMGQAAADVTLDFQRGGKFTKSVNQVVPFFNVAFIGANKLYRAASHDAAFLKAILTDPAQAKAMWESDAPRFAARAFAYSVVPSLVQAVMNYNNEAYWNQPSQDRDRNWYFPLMDYDEDGRQEWLVLPKPYGLGLISNIVDRSIASYLGIDPVSGKRGSSMAWKSAGSLLTDLRPPLNVPFITPLIELITNHSFYYGSPIVRAAEQRGPLGERGAERSSELAYALGSSMDVPPPYIDYAIGSLLGGMGRSLNDFAVSPLLSAATGSDRPVKKSRPNQLEFMPVLRRFMREENQGAAEVLTEFHSRYATLERVNEGLRALARQGRGEEVKEYLDRHDRELQGYAQMRPFKNANDKLYEQLQRVYRSDNLSEDERRTKERELYAKIHENVRRGLTALGSRQ